MISVEKLTYCYKGQQNSAVKNISFEVHKGEIFGFLGPSGSGKSTTQKILIRLLKNYNGDITMLGKDLKQWNGRLYERIGVGFELPNHYEKLTALENLEFISSFYKKIRYRPLQLLEMVGLEDSAKVRVEKYSKGMKMRLNFIRALMHDPEILFLDEPTSGLDPANSRIVKNIIKDWRDKGKTIFLTTHNMHDAEELCAQVSFIVDGEIRIIDSPDNLKAKFGKRSIKVDYRSGDQNQIKYFPLERIGVNEEFINILKNFPIRSIHTEDASMDDIFIKVTGKAL